MKKYIIFIIVVAFITLIFGLMFYTPLKTSKVKTNSYSKPTITEINYEANFLIFTNGTRRIFTDSMYHNLSGDVYIKGGNPSSVIVKKTGITWKDFFKTLPMSLNYECLVTGTGQTFCSDNAFTLKFYINGVKTDGALDRVIKDKDRLIISFGNESQEEIKNQLKQAE